MTREQIEQTAKDYAYKTWAGGGFECASNDSFIAGARWRINYVWHNADESPERTYEPIIVEFHDWGMDGNDYDIVDDLRTYKTVYSDVIRWAYVSDLIPERKEEEK